MADIEAYLLETYNGTAPQHKVKNKRKFEISEGSDGATHTKIVDANGEPLSTIPVQDTDLKTELEIIKAQQQQILSRLDEPIPTQVTGSNVEYTIERLNINETINPNGILNIPLDPGEGKLMKLIFISADIRSGNEYNHTEGKYGVGLNLGGSLGAGNQIIRIRVNYNKPRIAITYNYADEYDDITYKDDNPSSLIDVINAGIFSDSENTIYTN